MIDPLSTWKSTLAALPKVSDNSWAANFAAWYVGRIVSIIPDSTHLTVTSFLFIFAESTFAAQLQSLAPTTNQAAGIAGFANAWATAIAMTLFPATLNVGSGSFIPPASNATTFSVVNSVLLDPSSITAAEAKINELATATPVDDPNNSQFPVKFRDATLLMTITVSGLDSTPTPAGPLPLTAANVPLT